MKKLINNAVQTILEGATAPTREVLTSEAVAIGINIKFFDDAEIERMIDVIHKTLVIINDNQALYNSSWKNVLNELSAVTVQLDLDDRRVFNSCINTLDSLIDKATKVVRTV